MAPEEPREKEEVVWISWPPTMQIQSGDYTSGLGAKRDGFRQTRHEDDDVHFS
jgi:hypothetical protein